ncbi:hypothetical protein [Mycolicibacterium sp. CBMA 234]|uniref:hypothetical protein n=1 Tax=Mycolicibacterium sp. CBMA 234 TaxID=1918495 RepID=UPI0012DF5560|nr:hypothetical protein [Mycolicibacterium sp. CBMA 234]
MNKILSCAVALSLLGGSLAGVGIANATTPTVVGRTYSDAAGVLSKWRFPFEVSTTLGTELSRDDCVVVNQVLRPAQHFGATSNPAKLLLSLDCNAQVADVTHAGNSAASPIGRAAKLEAAKEAWLRANPDVCVQMKAAHPDWFKAPVKGCEGAFNSEPAANPEPSANTESSSS